MIRILCADISAADDRVLERLYRQASAERKYRADRCLRREDRLRCVAADALLRAVLGTGEYRTELGPGGKPYIKDRPDFYYNLSHSGDYVVIAWGDRPVGVDVQRHESGTDVRAVARRFFTPEEQVYIESDEAQLRSRFYEIWTKKESYLKYTGRGLGMALDSFSVLLPETGICYDYRLLGNDHSLSVCAEQAVTDVQTVELRLLP